MEDREPLLAENGSKSYASMRASAPGNRLSETATSISWSRSVTGLSFLASPADIDYDSPEETEQLAQQGIGARDWTRNHEAIDWFADAVKDRIRRKRLHQLSGLRGRILRVYDKLTGWIVVSLVGVLTASVGFGVVRVETYLFDLKDGYCATGWTNNRQFCCPQEALSALANDTACPAWRTWSEVLNGTFDRDIWFIDQLVLLVISTMLAVCSALLTVYLSSSENVLSAKDVPLHLQASSEAHIQHDEKQSLPLQKTRYYAAGSGIPEVKSILSGFVLRGFLGLQILFVKSFGLALSVASGLNLGKEGPTVQIAACVANLTTRFFKKYNSNESKRREIIGAATAAGVAVAFGSPIGGVLFAIEETLYMSNKITLWRSFLCASIAYAALRYYDPFHNGKTVMFEVTYDRPYQWQELVAFALLGVFGGIFGAAFCKLNILWSQRIRNATFLSRHPILEVALVAMLTVLLSLWNPFTKMSGTELVREMLSECRVSDSFNGLCMKTSDEAMPLLKSLAVTFFTKSLLTIITFGIKVPAGVFIPSLCAGAVVGRTCGVLLELVYDHFPHSSLFVTCAAVDQAPFGQRCILPGIWAMVGAISTLVGVTRTTLSLVVIVCELTGSLNYILPLQVAVLTSKVTADLFVHMSIYDMVIQTNKLPYLEDCDSSSSHELGVTDIADMSVPVIHLADEHSLASLQVLLEQHATSSQGFPLLRRGSDNKDRCVGYLGMAELALALNRYRERDPSTACEFRPLLPGTPIATLSMPPTPRTITSFGAASDAAPCNFGLFCDFCPLTVSLRSPTGLLQELFYKLGVRHLIVTDEEGAYVGVIDKLRWLEYLEWSDKGDPPRPFS